MATFSFPNLPFNFNFNWTPPNNSRQRNYWLVGVSTGLVMHRALSAKASVCLPNQGESKEKSSNGLGLPNFTILVLSNLPEWFKWIIRMALFFVIPYYKKILRVQDTAKSVLDVVESVAEVTEKIAEEVAENAPENSKLKEVAETVDKVSETIGDGAQLVEDIIDKIDDVLDDVAIAVKPANQEKEDTKSTKSKDDKKSK